jgi:light-regulated signal transduction histidine kinase (bacteriophytochrome)
MIGLAYDVTDHRDSEEKLRKKTEQLASANRGLESFSYSVAHDLRAPLQTIKNYSHFLSEDQAEKLGKEGLDYLNRIQAASTRMKVIIDNLMGLAKISWEEITLEDIDITALAHSIIDELKMTELSREVTTTIEEGLKAKGDPRLISVALTNLIGNAWKFTSRNPVSKIEIGAADINGSRVLFVRDNGVGFDMKRAKNLFKPFKRLHAENQFKGSGIGLATVYRVIERHGGRIWAESEINKGTAFYFTLPENTN